MLNACRAGRWTWAADLGGVQWKADCGGLVSSNVLKWRNKTTMLPRRIYTSAMLCCLACTGCEQQPEQQLALNDIPTLPPHWRNVTGQGMDSRVGRFESTKLALIIHYDIGELAGEYADTDPYPGYQWIRSGRLYGSSFRYLLNEDDTLYVTFPDEGPANFWAKVADDAEINYVLEFLARYRNDLLGS